MAHDAVLLSARLHTCMRKQMPGRRLSQRLQTRPQTLLACEEGLDCERWIGLLACVTLAGITLVGKGCMHEMKCSEAKPQPLSGHASTSVAVLNQVFAGL